MADVICIGNAAVDVPLATVDSRVFHIDSYPIERILPGIGGSALNVSTIVKRLGYQTALMAHIGKDKIGEIILEHCEETGIDISALTIDSRTNTPLSIGLVRSDGERTFIVAKESGTFCMNLEDIDFDMFSKARLLILSSIFINPKLDNNALVQIFKKAKENDLIVCADMIKSRDQKTFADIKEALSYVDFFFLNLEEAKWLTKKSDLREISDEIIGCGVKTVIIKLGKDGCYIRNKETEYQIEGMTVDCCADTIGAGDNFAAGFVTALLDGLSLYECAAYANQVAAISVQHFGAVSGVRNRDQVMETMKNNR